MATTAPIRQIGERQKDLFYQGAALVNGQHQVANRDGKKPKNTIFLPFITTLQV
jgi:hypothetical protein